MYVNIPIVYFYLLTFIFNYIIKIFIITHFKVIILLTNYQTFISCKYNEQVVNKMSKQKEYQVLLYYNFTTIEDPEEFALEHLEFCKEIGLKGRILVSHNGINGTVSGTVEQTQIY